MQYFLLGPLEVRDGDRLLAVPAGKQRALLADLLLHANRVVPVERLLDDLWGASVPDTAVKALQVHLSKVRRALPAAVIETRTPGYMLRIDDDSLDLHRFERLLREGRGALAAADPERAATDLGAALALWRGRALTDIAEPFAAGESARLEELRLGCVEDRFEVELQLGRHASLAGEIEAAAREHPFRERLRSQLMLALYRSGRQAEALESFQAFRRELRDELGIDPSEGLRDLERRILRQDPTLAAPVSRPVGVREAGSPSRRGRNAPVVGRDAELQRLRGILEGAAAGDRALVFVTGEPGAGKTTLVHALLDGVPPPAGCRIARGQCIEHRGQGEPYLPLLEALGRLARADERGQTVELLRERAPTWLAQLPGLVPPEEHVSLRLATAGTTRERMLREMVELLDAAAAAAPLVLVLEDLHWSDVSTLDLLDALARRPDAARLLVIGTFRRTDRSPGARAAGSLASELRLRGLCTEIEVHGLAEGAVREYLESRRPGLDADAAVVELVHDRTRGNPLFMEKLVEAWTDDERIVAEEGQWRVAADVGGLSSDVPSSLRQLITQRIAALDADERAVLEAASVVGGTFPTNLVAAATSVDAERVDAVYSRLCRDELFVERSDVRVWPDGTASPTYSFTHDLWQEVLVLELAAARRAAIHDAVAKELASLSGDGDELVVEIAWHASNGTDRGLAVRNLLLAARRSLERQAFHEARGHLTAATEALRGLPQSPATARLELGAHTLVGATEIAIDGWGSTAAERAYEQARALAAHLGATDDLALVLSRLATLHEYRGQYRASASLLEQTLALSSGGDAVGRRIYSHELLACSLFHQGDHHSAIRHAETALSLYDGVVDPVAATGGASPVVSCHTWAALALWHLGFADQARGRAERALTLATLGPERNGRPMAHAQAAVVALCRGEEEETARLSEQALVTAEELGHDYWRAVGHVTRGFIRARGGDPGDGMAEIRLGIEEARLLGARMDEPFFLALLAECALADGRVDEADEALAHARRPTRAGRDFFYAPELLRLDALVQAETGEADAALARLDAATGSARYLGALSLELRAATTRVQLALRGIGEADPAAHGLADVLSQLPEGAGTEDVRRGHALLAQTGVA